MCAPCHTIGVGDRVGPDLRGVTIRRDKPWLEAFIQNPSKMRAKQDPIALALAAEYPAVRMPAVGLAPADAADLISYLTTETARLEEAKGPRCPSTTIISIIIEGRAAKRSLAVACRSS